MQNVNLFSRGSGLLKEGAQKRLQDMKITIVGCGAIGSWLGTALAKMGCENVTYYENDIVEASNYNNQIFGEDDIGKHKLDAMKDHMAKYQVATSKWVYHKKFLTPFTEDKKAKTKTKNIIDAEVLILAVDSIKVRGEITEAFKYSEGLKILLDGRIGRTVGMGFAVNIEESVELDYYQKREIYPSEQAAQIPCTEKTFVSPCQFISAFMTGAIHAYVNDRLAKFPLKAYIDFAYFNVQQTPRNHALLLRSIS